MPRYLSSMAEPAARSTSIFAAPSAKCWARLPEIPGAPAVAVFPAPRGPGRPKLGVVAREVTLLPRHWEWLARQSGGASVALRKLVDEARRANKDKDRIRHAQEAAYRFVAAMGENKPHYEEVARALFSGDAVSDSGLGNGILARRRARLRASACRGVVRTCRHA